MLNNILLINDDDLANLHTADLIRSLGISKKITSFLDGSDALDYITETDGHGEEEFIMPELILLDINMPVMDGFEFLHNYNYLIHEEGFKKIFTVVITSFIDQEVLSMFTAFNMIKGYIELPVSRESLLKVAKKVEASLVLS
jgi:CheY-like chemotaxis protein